MQSKPVDAPITAEIKDYSVVIEHGINTKTNAKDACDADPAYETSTAITLSCKILSPSEHSGSHLELELFSSHFDSYRREYTSTLKDWRNSKSTNDEDLYVLPSSIGHIGRSRNKKMIGYLQVSPRVVSDLVLSIKLNKPIYIKIKAQKLNGERTVHSIVVQHRETE